MGEQVDFFGLSVPCVRRTDAEAADLGKLVLGIPTLYRIAEFQSEISGLYAKELKQNQRYVETNCKPPPLKELRTIRFREVEELYLGYQLSSNHEKERTSVIPALVHYLLGHYSQYLRSTKRALTELCKIYYAVKGDMEKIEADLCKFLSSLERNLGYSFSQLPLRVLREVEFNFLRSPEREEGLLGTCFRLIEKSCPCWLIAVTGMFLRMLRVVQSDDKKTALQEEAGSSAREEETCANLVRDVPGVSSESDSESDTSEEVSFNAYEAIPIEVRKAVEAFAVVSRYVGNLKLHAEIVDLLPGEFLKGKNACQLIHWITTALEFWFSVSSVGGQDNFIVPLLPSGTIPTAISHSCE